MRTLSAWLVAMTLTCLGMPAANANVIYQFVGNVSGPATGNAGFTLEVSDQAVQSGAFSFGVTGKGPGCGPPTPFPCTFFGDPTALVFLANNHFLFASPTHALGTYSVSLTFDSSGEVTGGGFSITGQNEDFFSVKGTGNSFTGGYSSDFLSLCGPCTVTGSFSAPVFVPEPGSFAIFAAALMLLVLARPGRRPSRVR